MSNKAEQDKAIIDKVFDNLQKDINNKERATIPESIFINVYLPVLATGNLDENSSIIKDYINVAGGPYEEMDIVDHTGKVKATLPPLYASVEPTNDINVSALGMHYQDVVAQGLPDRISDTTDTMVNMISDNVKVNTPGWDDIFNMYKPALPISDDSDDDVYEY